MNYLGDTSFFLPLVLESHPHHKSASDWLGELPGQAQIFMCRGVQNSFLRLLTVREWLKEDVCTNEDAIKHYTTLMSDSRFQFFPGEPAGLEKIWLNYAAHPKPSPKLWTDAYLAAFARTAKLNLVTFDHAFASFASVQTTLLRP